VYGDYTRAVAVAVGKCIVVENVGGGVLVETSLASMIRWRKDGLEELENLDLNLTLCCQASTDEEGRGY
jgi:hypothetical protein